MNFRKVTDHSQARQWIGLTHSQPGVTEGAVVG